MGSECAVRDWLTVTLEPTQSKTMMEPVDVPTRMLEEEGMPTAQFARAGLSSASTAADPALARAAPATSSAAAAWGDLMGPSLSSCKVCVSSMLCPSASHTCTGGSNTSVKRLPHTLCERPALDVAFSRT